MEGRPRLIEAFKKFRADWGRLRELWQDEQQAAFEREVIEPIEAHTREMLSVMERLGTYLHQARRDCEGRGGNGL